MNWFKITFDAGDDGGTFAGCTADSLEMLAERPRGANTLGWTTYSTMIAA